MKWLKLTGVKIHKLIKENKQFYKYWVGFRNRWVCKATSK